MMAAQQHFIYSGGGRDGILQNATHVIIHHSVTVIPEGAFAEHPNIVDLFCHHDGVERIEKFAFCYCPCLKKRVIMRGVKVVEAEAFYGCENLQYIVSPELERIGELAFCECTSLININLTSAVIVEEEAFHGCEALVCAIFGNDLEPIRRGAFKSCPSLERITIPLKHGLINYADIFQGCRDLKRVDLVEGAVHETIATLQLEEWRNDINMEINSINQSLPNARAGDAALYDAGDKGLVVQNWITRVLHNIIDYKAQHRSLVNEAVSILAHAKQNDTVTNNILPFLALPSYTFQWEWDEVEN